MGLRILGIETSCDETAASVYDNEDGVLSSAIYSQIELHKKFGGVVPEIASRSQLEKINPIIEQALSDAKITLNDIDCIAVTHKPGLPGSLLVGVCFAKSIAWTQEKPLIGIDHLEAHAFSPFLEHDVPFPHLCLTASGGHTAIYLVKDFGNYTILGQTIDDAAGEAFDKVAKMLELGYPGGPIIEKYAAQAGFKDFFSYPRGKNKDLNFSFSGLKTAVLYNLIDQNAYDLKEKKLLDTSQELKEKVASSLLVCISDIFKEKIKKARKEYPDIKAVTFAGGVACNSFIRNDISNLCKKYNLPFFTPSPRYCGDNAAMVAFVGSYKAARQQFSDLFLDILR